MSMVGGHKKYSNGVYVHATTNEDYIILGGVMML